jgi:hypothetical protein
MGFFESCSTMPAWQAWLFAAGTSLASLTVSTVYHQVKNILFDFQINIKYFFVSIFIKFVYVV